MKLVFTFAILFTSIIQIQGQTISPEWFYKIGHETITVYVSNSQTFQTPEEELDGIWDFSEAIDAGIDDNLIYSDPQAFTWSDSFPNANIGAKDISNNFYNNFYQEDEGNLLFWGFTTETNSGSEYLTIYSSPVSILECPILFGSSFEDTFTYRTYLDNQFIGESTGTRKTSFAGTGTVITPSGTFDNCFMLKIENEENGGPTPFVAYNFYKNNLSNIVASYIEQGVTTTGEVQKIVSYQVGNLNPTATKNLVALDADLIVLNNNTLQFNSREVFRGQFSLYSVDGKLLSNESINFLEGSNIISINSDIKGVTIGVLTDAKSQRFKSFKIHLQGS